MPRIIEGDFHLVIENDRITIEEIQLNLKRLAESEKIFYSSDFSVVQTKEIKQIQPTVFLDVVSTVTTNSEKGKASTENFSK